MAHETGWRRSIAFTIPLSVDRAQAWQRGAQRRTAVVANACAAGSWTRFRISIPAIAMTRAATQPSKNAFILSLPRLSQQAIYTTRLAAGKRVDRTRACLVPSALEHGIGPKRIAPPSQGPAARRYSREGCGRWAVGLHASEPKRALQVSCRLVAPIVRPLYITVYLPVLLGTLPCWKLAGSACAYRLSVGATSSRSVMPATTAGLDGPDQYGFGRRAGRQSPGPEPARHAGRPGGIVQDHDGAGQVDRFGMFISGGSSGNLDAVNVSRAGQR